MNSSVHFSSATAEWATPQDFFDKCNAEFGPFDLDPCATAENAKCSRYFTKKDNGLAQEWTGRVWMNPPYGREIGAWMAKAFHAAQGGGYACLLFGAIAHGHGLVARLCREGGGAIYSWPPEIRWLQKLCAIPVGARNF